MTVALVDRARGGFTYEAGFGVSFLKKGAFVRFEDTSVTEVAKTGQTSIHRQSCGYRRPLANRSLLIRGGFRSQIRTPLVLKDGIARF